PDTVVAQLLGQVQPRSESAPKSAPARAATAANDAPLTTDSIAVVLSKTATSRAVSLLHLPLSWNAASYAFRHPLEYLGSVGGGGIGAGPGNAVGAALALRGSGRLPIAVCG